MSTELNKVPPLALIADDEQLGRVLLIESVAEVGLQSLDFDNGTDACAAALANDVAQARARGPGPPEPLSLRQAVRNR